MPERESGASLNDSLELERRPFLSETTDDLGDRPKVREQTSSRSMHIVFAVCVLCTIINAALLLRTSQAYDSYLSSRTPILKLPRPNQYIGFERINRSALESIPPDPIRTQADFMLQVSSKHPARVLPHEEREKLMQFGLFTRIDRHFSVRQQISTVARFHVRDYGMEDCQIVLDIPLDGAPSVEDTSEIAVRNGSVVEIWPLDSTTAAEMDEAKVSWKTKPARVGSAPFATLTLAQTGRWMTTHFHCDFDAALLYEFACGKEHCLVDFWQNGLETVPQVYLLQHNSI